VFSAGKDFRVFLDGKDLVPAARKRKRDGVATGSGESIDQDVLVFRRCCNVFCYLAVMSLADLILRVATDDALSDRFRCYAKPRIVGHPDTSIVL